MKISHSTEKGTGITWFKYECIAYKWNYEKNVSIINEQEYFQRNINTLAK